MKRIDKQALVAHIRGQIAAEIAAATKAARDAAAAATHEEAKPENDKDTRGLEASYLARGQAERVRELERSDNLLQFMDVRDLPDEAPIAAGALAELEAEGVSVVYFVAPAGGGTRVTVEGLEVQIVTPQSPVGQALLGRQAGDVVDVRVRGIAREYEILEVR